MRKLMAALGLMAALVFMPSSAKAVGGAQICSMGTSTGTVVILCSGQSGTLYDIELDTAATAGDFITCYDSASASGFVAGVGGECPNAGLNVCTQIMNVTAVATNTGYHAAQPVSARRYLNGLVCLKRVGTTSGRALFLAN